MSKDKKKKTASGRKQSLSNQEQAFIKASKMKRASKKPLGKIPFDYFSELWGKYERSAKSSSV